LETGGGEAGGEGAKGTRDLDLKAFEQGFAGEK